MQVALLQTEFNLRTSEYTAREKALLHAHDEAVRSSLPDPLSSHDPLETIPRISAKDAQHVASLVNSIKEVEQLQKELVQTYVPLNIPAYKVTAEGLHAKGFDDWSRLTKEDVKRTYNETDRKAYEYFVQGWICYFEEMMKEQNTPKSFTLYFDWGNTRPDCALVIYIKPRLEKQVYMDYTLPAPPPSMTDPVKPPPPPPPTQR